LRPKKQRNTRRKKVAHSQEAFGGRSADLGSVGTKRLQPTCSTLAKEFFANGVCGFSQGDGRPISLNRTNRLSGAGRCQTKDEVCRLIGGACCPQKELGNSDRGRGSARYSGPDRQDFHRSTLNRNGKIDVAQSLKAECIPPGTQSVCPREVRRRLVEVTRALQQRSLEQRHRPLTPDISRASSETAGPGSEVGGRRGTADESPPAVPRGRMHVLVRFATIRPDVLGANGLSTHSACSNVPRSFS